MDGIADDTMLRPRSIAHSETLQSHGVDDVTLERSANIPVSIRTSASE